MKFAKEQGVFAVETFGKTGADAREAVTALEIRRDEDDVHYVRNTAARALKRIRP